MSAEPLREETILEQALTFGSKEARLAYLQGACGGDERLCARVESLIEAHEAAGGFLKSRAGGTNGVAATVLLPITEKPGDRIGRYKLLQQIGEGGCGVVYMAEQEEPVRRRVALKVIKLGMDTKSVIARFEAERQALALMDHPNIAKVLDAGATETGRPYFVMELVRGVKITDYCDQNNLSTRERLDLYIQVCHAIQHAHQKGIIHRDIKPSNILVSLHDGVAAPVVIDFGIAKATEQRLTDKTLFTAFEQFIGTPSYMSPEQAEMSRLDIDTRSDIYSLGVLLYELLTGKTPFDSKELLAAGLDEMRRTIREQEPARPSTRLSRLEPKEQTTTAQRRATEPPKLIRSLRGDLDWIAMKCLEKNRTRRYATANDLARDIECHLNHQPVSAAAPTLGYRTAKYVRRHRRVLATAVAFAVLLILGTTVSMWQARRAGQAEQERGSLRKVKWALETAMPEIERLLDKDDYTPAFELVEQARPFLADNPRFQALSKRAVSVITIETTPPGAQVFIRDYRELNPNWAPIGKSPLNAVKVPRGFKRWKITMPEYEPAEGALLVRSKPVEVKVKLDKTGTIPAEMVRIQGKEFKASLDWLDRQTLPVLNLSDFLLDRYEVANRQFKQFVEAGGYKKPEYWKHKFIKDGIELSWQAAMQLFVDETGQPGPATWKDGAFPKGQEDYPVGGVSWYEAAAYAEFAGKRLPTVYHWSLAAGDWGGVDAGYIIPLSNFGGKGPAPVGTFQGMTSHGIYDLAGNVKEWCFNETPNGYRVIAGGGWNEPQYLYGVAETYPPFFRGADFGFRCMKLLTEDGVWEQAGCSVHYQPPPDLGDQKPCSDEVFQAYKKLYDYNKSELQSSIELTEDLSIYTRREKVSFNAAYGNERMIAYLYLPRTGKPPFQTVVYFPGSDALALRSMAGYGDVAEGHTRKGRAFVFPVLQGTFERMAPPEKQGKTTALEDGIMWVKDFERTIDYLETRPEFDISKLAFEGLSWGGIWGGILPAIETRIKVAVLPNGGLDLGLPPECSQVNFAPRIKIPILLQNGKYDNPSREPYFRLFGTAEKDKQHRIYETGHGVWSLNEARKDGFDFLDKYLGPVK
jgi:formylglycine-generating enzyme required for sulfatase activity/dienelactone hydrolase/predicted Ser/Thr protein kinase